MGPTLGRGRTDTRGPSSFAAAAVTEGAKSQWDGHQGRRHGNDAPTIDQAATRALRNT